MQHSKFEKRTLNESKGFEVHSLFSFSFSISFILSFEDNSEMKILFFCYFFANNLIILQSITEKGNEALRQQVVYCQIQNVGGFETWPPKLMAHSYLACFMNWPTIFSKKQAKPKTNIWLFLVSSGLANKPKLNIASS